MICTSGHRLSRMRLRLCIRVISASGTCRPQKRTRVASSGVQRAIWRSVSSAAKTPSPQPRRPAPALLSPLWIRCLSGHKQRLRPDHTSAPRPSSAPARPLPRPPSQHPLAQLHPAATRHRAAHRSAAGTWSRAAQAWPREARSGRRGCAACCVACRPAARCSTVLKRLCRARCDGRYYFPPCVCLRRGDCIDGPYTHACAFATTRKASVQVYRPAVAVSYVCGLLSVLGTVRRDRGVQHLHV